MSKHIIELKNINKIYYNSLGEVITNALKNINFTVNKGDFIAIMGQSGSGKSTLMNLLGFLDSPTSGEYIFKSENTTEFDDIKLSKIRNKEVGFVFQSFNLLPKLTVAENIMLPMFYAGIDPKLQNERVDFLLDLVNLSDRKSYFPPQLSGGQKQRVAIARSLANDPSIIMADEPTGNLDSASGNEIMKFLQDLNKKGNTILLITHEPEIAEYAKKVVYIQDGVLHKEK